MILESGIKRAREVLSRRNTSHLQFHMLRLNARYPTPYSMDCADINALIACAMKPDVTIPLIDKFAMLRKLESDGYIE